LLKRVFRRARDRFTVAGEINLLDVFDSSVILGQIP